MPGTGPKILGIDVIMVATGLSAVAVLLLIYALYRKDPVFIAGQSPSCC